MGRSGIPIHSRYIADALAWEYLGGGRDYFALDTAEQKPMGTAMARVANQWRRQATREQTEWR